MTSRSSVGVLLLAAVGLAPVAGVADPSAPAVEQRRQPVAAPAADVEYDRGVRARVLGRLREPVGVLRRDRRRNSRSAVAVSPAFAAISPSSHRASAP